MRKENWLDGCGKLFKNNLTVVLLLLLFFSELGLAQSSKEKVVRISLEAKDEPMSVVLKKIEQASHYKIIFTYDEIQNYKVTVSVKNKPINEVIRTVIGNYPLAYKVKNIFVTIYAIKPEEAQKKISGVVIDNNGEPMIGVNILTDKAGLMDVTNIDGEFEINIPEGQTVENVFFSCIGQKKMTVAYTGKPLYVTMEDDTKQLDELVVVGYGVQKKSSLTSSIEIIKSEDLLKMPTANLSQALVGQVAGLSVITTTGDPTGKDPKMSIRGIVGEPLLVIDGVPRFGTNTSDSETRLSDLNPDDIESISILKDGAAAAVYGARAARGVILVTTKRAAGDNKIHVNYRGQYNMQKATRFPEFLNAYEFAKLYNQALSVSPSFEGKYAPYTDAQLEQIRTNSAPNTYGNENLFDYLSDHGSLMTHSLSLNGGSKDIKYYISGGYANNTGLYSGVSRDRYNYSMKLDVNLSKSLSLSMDVTGTRSDNKNTSYSTIDAAYNFAPTQLLQYPDGRLTSLDGSNPLIAVRGLGGYVQNKARINSTNLTLRYAFPWLNGLTAYARTVFDNNSARIKTYSSPVALYKTNSTTGEIEVDSKTIYPQANISLTENEQNLDNKLLEAGLNFDRIFGEKHNVTGLLLTNYQSTQNRYLSATNSSLSGVYPEVIGTGVTGIINGIESKTERASVVGRATYGYDYRYFFEGNFRVDGSTKFDPDYRWQIFPSFSASWVVTNEPFFKNWKQSVFSAVKLRASTGWLGDDGNIDNYSYQMKYIYTKNYGYSFGTGNTGFGVIPATEAFPNVNLKMEQRHDYNMAMDLGFWDNRFSVSYEYYWRYRTNMITQVPAYLYPPSAGVGGRYPYVNIGEVKEWGWDITLSHKNTIGHIKYNIDLMVSKMDNQVLDWGDESSLIEGKQRKGKSYMTWTLYQADGLFRSQEEIDNYKVDQDGYQNTTLMPGDIKYVDMNGDDKITEQDMVYVKNSSYPDFSFSVKTGFSYKGFFVNAIFQGLKGFNQQLNEIYSLYNSSLPKFQNYHLYDSWTEDNPNAKYPRVQFSSVNSNNRRASTFWIQECDFIRLRSLNIGYSLPTSWLKSSKMSSVNIALQGGNLFAWSTLDNVDPESLRGYPVQRSYGASLSVGF